MPAMIPASPSTEALLERASQGDEPARQRLLERFRRQLRQLIAARLDSRLAARVDASDVVQETLIDAARRMDEYFKDRPLPFLAWLGQIANERVIDTHRRHLAAQRRSVARESRPRNESDPPDTLALRLEADGTSPSGHLLRKERHDRLKAALELLPARDREVLVLRHLEQRGPSEIAERLGISEGAAKARLLRALMRLRSVMEGPP